MEPQDVHAAVRDTFTTASAPTAGAHLAGYTDAQLAGVPSGVSSFGCGNPLAFASVRAGQTVLDLGCGPGLDLILAAQVVGPTGRVIGIDMTPGMVARARSNVARAGLENVVVERGLVEALPVPDASIDWVLSNCVISLSPDKGRVFREIARVLRPGGEMLISDIVVDDHVAAVLRRIERVAPSMAMARTEADYLSAARIAGLRDARVEGRLVYDASQLAALFGADALRSLARLVPVSALAHRVEQGVLGRRAVGRLAQLAEGRVSSIKLRARRAAD